MFKSLKIQMRLLIKITETFFGIENKKQSQYASNFINLDDVSLSYIKAGTGKLNVVLLHGWGQSKETWEEIIKSRENSHTMYAVDLPGFGESTLNNAIKDLKDYARILEKFLISMNISNCILVGHSFGGRIATLYTINYPQKVKKLVIYSTNLPVRSKKNKIWTSLLTVIASPIAQTIVRIYLDLRKKSFSRYKQLLKIYIHSNSSIFFEKLSVFPKNKEVVLLAGSLDFITTLEDARRIKKMLPRAKLIIFHKSSHFAHLEEKDELDL